MLQTIYILVEAPFSGGLGYGDGCFLNNAFLNEDQAIGSAIELVRETLGDPLALVHVDRRWPHGILVRAVEGDQDVKVAVVSTTLIS